MDRKASGHRAQRTGDQAENKVQDVLTDAGISCAKMSIDLGEDFLVELGAYSADIAPRIGMLQIKGHLAANGIPADLGHAKRIVLRDKLERWATHPNPVLLIAVELAGGVAIFFAETLDKLILDNAPNGLAELSQRSLTVTLPRRDDLPAYVRDQITAFYAKTAFDLSGLPKTAIQRNHYEILSRTDPAHPPGAMMRSASFRLLWKGPWRPAHFWASLNHFADELQNLEADASKPFTAAIHVYRSFHDMTHNNAVAHISWVEKGRPETDAIKTIMRFPKLKQWTRFRFNYKPHLSAVPDHQLPMTEDKVFIAEAGRIWAQLDRLFEVTRENLTPEFRIKKDLLQKIDDELNLLFLKTQKLGFPSVQYETMDRLLQNYAMRLGDVIGWVKDKPDISELTRRRWLDQDLDIALGLYKAFKPIEAHLSDRMI